MRILFVTQWFQPEPNYKGLNLARALQERGHEVEVLTGFPNYPGGEVYPGYRLKLSQKEVMDGIPVQRCYLYPSHDSSILGRIANYASFAMSTSLAVLRMRRPDVVFIYTPPITAALPAVVLRLTRGVPYVVDIQDLWPDTLAATGMVRSEGILKLVGAFTDFVLQRARRIVVLSNGFRERLTERGIRTPIAVVRNWAPPELAAIANELALSEQSASEPSDEFCVLYAGNVGRAQGLDVVVEAAGILQSRGVPARFEIIGGGLEADRLRKLGESTAPDRIRFHPYRHPAEMGPAFAQADALLVHLRKDPLFEITIPSKIQAYLAIGKPILAGLEGDGADLIRDARAGIVFEPGDAEALADAVSEMVAMSAEERRTMGHCGSRYYRDQLAFDIGVDLIAAELEEAIKPDGFKQR